MPLIYLTDAWDLRFLLHRILRLRFSRMRVPTFLRNLMPPSSGQKLPWRLRQLVTLKWWYIYLPDYTLYHVPENWNLTIASLSFLTHRCFKNYLFNRTIPAKTLCFSIMLTAWWADNVINCVLGRLNEAVWPCFLQLLPAALACTPRLASLSAPWAPTILLSADTPGPKQRERERRSTETLVPTHQTTRRQSS
jgi:hypothetical protein